MSLFDQHRPKTSQAAKRQRERQLMRKLEQLLEIADEAQFLAALQEEFEIDRNSEPFNAILSDWRKEHRRGG